MKEKQPWFYTHHDIVDEAIAFIREHEPAEGYHLGFSGGKDSTVLKHLAILSGAKFEAVYACTGIDPPEVVRFIREFHPDVVFKFPIDGAAIY